MWLAFALVVTPAVLHVAHAALLADELAVLPASSTSLDLSNRGLTGSIPTDIGRFTELESLNLGGNQLTGSIPPELGSLTALTRLGLHSNQLTGSIPAELGNLTALTHLFLSVNMLTGSIPAELGNLTALTYIYLNNNQLTGSIPPKLGSLTALTQLFLSNNQLTGSVPPELGSLTALGILDLSFNQLAGSIPPELGSLTALTQLGLHNNQLAGSIPAELGSLYALTHLFLSNNQLTGSIPPELGSLTALRQLYLPGNQLTGTIPAELGSLTALMQLSLDNNQLTGSIPPELGSLTALMWLDLQNNQLAGSIPAELGSLTALRVLWLNANQLTSSIPAELGNLTELTRLYLHGNQLTGSIPAELGSLTALRVMLLNDNQLTGRIPPELGSLTALTRLYLHGNQLTGSIPAELGSLTALTELYLHGNQLTGSIPAELGSLTALTQLWLESNQLTGSIPAELGNLTALTSLSLDNNQLSGSIPSVIGMLLQLRNLSVSYNSFDGQLPDMSEAHALEFIYARRCNLLGAAGSLGRNVTTVDVSENMFTSLPVGWRDHSRITSLDISANNISEWPRNGVIPERYLGSDGTIICGYDPAADGRPRFGWNELKTLDLSNNPLRLVSARDFLYSLSYLPNLEELMASNCSLHSEVHEGVFKDTREHTGDAYCQGQATIELAFPSLRRLELAQNRISQLNGLPPVHLVEADLSHNELSGSLDFAWFNVGGELRVRGNKNLTASILEPQGPCPQVADDLRADPELFQAPAEDADAGYECTVPCRTRGLLQVSPEYLNVSSLCRCRRSWGGSQSWGGSGQDCSACPADTYWHSDDDTFHMVSACLPCPEHASTYGAVNVTSIAGCECPHGSFLNRSGITPSCSFCQPGTYAGSAGLEGCSPCAPGEYSSSTGSRACSLCPAGSYASEMSTSCSACPIGMTTKGLQSTSSSDCFTPDMYYVSTVGFLAAITAIALLLPMAAGVKLQICDIHEEKDGIVVTVQAPHNVLQQTLLSPKVFIEGSGAGLLDSAKEKHTAKMLGYKRLLLGTKPDPKRPAEASMGRLSVAFPQSLLCTGILAVPVIVLLLAALAMAATFVILHPRLDDDEPFQLHEGLALGAAVLGIVLLRGLALLRTRLIKSTPLHRKLQAYEASLGRDCLLRVDRGPQRAISAARLFDFHNFFEEFIRRRNMYYLVPNIVVPCTARAKVSFAELIGPSRVNWFVSHFWGNAFTDFVHAIKSHAEAMHGGGWERASYWICCFSNNQWTIEQELGGENPENSSFFLALKQSKGTVMILDKEAMPLSRAWCLFEVTQTQRQSERHDFLGLCLATSTGILNEANASVDVAMELGKKIEGLDLHQAQASNSHDKELIDRFVVDMGGFDHVNAFVKMEMCRGIEAMKVNVVAKLDKISEGLRGHHTLTPEDLEASLTGARCSGAQWGGSDQQEIVAADLALRL